MKKTNILDVAREAGVSKASVSNYLNGRDARLSETTKARIRDVVSRLRYTPAIGARRLSNKSGSYTLGVVLRHDLSYTFYTRFFSHVMNGIAQAGNELGYRVLLVASSPDRDADVGYCLSLAKGIVDGFLLFEIEARDAYVEAFERNKVPYVSFGKPDGISAGSWVATDQEGGSKQAVEHLLWHGHRRIALFPGPENLLVSERRAAGYRAAFREAGLEFEASRICFDRTGNADPRERYLDMLRSPQAPSAFIIPHSQAESFAWALRTSGRSPGDTALILADYFPEGDSFPATGAEPGNYLPISGGEGGGYTYVKSQVGTVGRTATAALVGIVSGKTAPEPVLFPTELIIGASCGCGRPAPAGKGMRNL